MKRIFPLLMLAAGLWLLAACTNPKKTPTSSPYPPPGEIVTLEVSPYPPPGEIVTLEASPYPAPEGAQVQPTPRTAMEATDPATVQLASGGPQLVEFFAFW